MRVLHIGGFYSEIGGPYSLLMHLEKATKEKGIQATILSPLPKTYDREKARAIHDASFRVRYITNDFLALFWPSYSKNWKSNILNILPSIDIIHVHGIFNYYAYVVSRFAKEKPYIISVHGSLMEDSISSKSNLKKTLYLKLIGHYILKKAFMIHLLNEKEKGDLAKACYMNFNQYKDKVKIIPTGIDISEFSLLPRKNSFRNKFPELMGKRYILFLGRLHPIKGLDILAEAYRKVASVYDDVLLVIAGPDNVGYGDKIKVWLRDYGLLGRVLFTGMLTGRDKFEAFVDAELFVLPSYSEASPMAVLEAMACEAPVVVSNKVGICEEIKTHKAGIVVNTDPESLFKGIETLLLNGELRKQFGGNGKRLLQEHHDINEVADRMIKVYEEILK